MNMTDLSQSVAAHELHLCHVRRVTFERLKGLRWLRSWSVIRSEDAQRLTWELYRVPGTSRMWLLTWVGYRLMPEAYTFDSCCLFSSPFELESLMEAVSSRWGK